MNNQLQHFIENHHTGKLNLKEQIELSELLSNPGNLSAEEFLLDDWISGLHTDSIQNQNLKAVLDQVHHRIRLKENSRKTEANWLHLFQRVAAILIIPLLLSFFAFFYFQGKIEPAKDTYAEIQCPMGARIKFQLPDGSVGYLNSGSNLKYLVGFPHGRNVDLTGEAYFEVVHNKNLPFHVNTKNLDIKVLGTTFDVIANEDENTEEVVLQTGKVDVSCNTGKQLATLNPNEHLTLNTKNKTFEKTEVEASQYTSWKEGKLVFRNENMQQVAQRLSRWYNAEVIVDDALLDNYTFHATFVEEPLDEVVKLLSLTTPLTYSEEKRLSDENGVFKKRKIILKIDHSKINQFK